MTLTDISLVITGLIEQIWHMWATFTICIRHIIDVPIRECPQSQKRPTIMLSWSPRALAASTGNFHKDCVSDSWQNLRSGNGSSEMVPRWLWAPFLCLFSLALVVVKLKSILYAFQLIKEIQVQSFTCHPITHKWDFSWSDNCWQRWPSSLRPERRGQNASSALRVPGFVPSK